MMKENKEGSKVILKNLPYAAKSVGNVIFAHK